MIKFIKLFTVFFLISLISFGQLSKTHYIPPLTHAAEGNANAVDQWLYISTPSTSDVNVSILPVGGTAQTITVRNDTPYKFQVSADGYSQLYVQANTTSRVMSNKGYIIDAEKPIYVSVRINAGGEAGDDNSSAQAGALVTKGLDGLGRTFRIGTFNSQSNSANFNNYLNFLSVMATEDNTTVNFTNNYNSGFVIENYGGQFPINDVQLNRGDSYVIALELKDLSTQTSLDAVTRNRDGLIGTLIESNKDIVVNSGSSNGSFHIGGARDYGIDQIVELSKVGNEYILVKGDGDNGWENILVVAHENATEISVFGSSNTTQTIDAGEYYLIEGDLFSTDRNMYISTNNDVFVYQGTGGGSEANQEMFFVPPISCGSRGDVNNIPFINEIGTKEFNGAVSIVTRKDATIEINGLDLNSQPNGINVNGPYDVPNKSEYVTYRVTGLSGNVSVTSSSELYVAYFTVNNSATSGAFYSGFATNPVLDLELNASKLGSCISESGISNVVISVSNNNNFDSVQWEKKNSDNSWTSLSNQTNSQFTPSEIGTYRVKGIIVCDNETVEYISSEIPISQCPDDFDNDGIIDNLDLDHDNDGILNSVESEGIGNIDFSNTTSPTINLSNGNSINGVISGTVTKSNDNQTLTGYTDSSLQMVVESGVDQELKYVLNFTENLNINIKDNPGFSAAIRNGESFIIKSSPVSSNITVLDPNDNLLIDTNFDDEYENNVTEFTSNEIRFKFNPNSTTTVDYELFATKIDGIAITHKYSTSNAGSSVFVPIIYAYDYNKDSDDDGNEDMFERDSDGDGCDDIIEADFTALENYQGDPDFDGVYGTGAQTFDNGNVTERGLIKVHNDANGYNTDPKKDSNNNYLFQVAGSPAEILSQPLSVTACEGANVDFVVSASSQSGELVYQWQFYNTSDEIWNNLDDNDSYSGTKTERLTVNSISSTLDGKYRVLVNSEYYLCDIESDPNVSLTVKAAPDDPIVNQIQTFCQTETPTIANLVATNNSASLTLNWYESEDATTPLDSSVELTHNTTYYAEFIDQEGCVSVTRTPSKAFLSNPILNASNEVICSGDGLTLTIDNVAKTASDFAAENDLIFITNNGTPVTWDSTIYGNTYFLIQAGTGQDGFDPIDWTTARDLTNIFNSGDSNTSARMYIVENAQMEKAVWDGLNSMGLTYESSQSQIYFWLGLYQDLDDPDYQEPGNADQNYAGWKWVNGQDLKDTYVNWWTGEPNDAGDEHYAQFEFSNNGIQWNDMSIGNGQSWPLFEYSGSSEIVWGYYNADGTEEIISDVTTTSYEVENLTETRTYFVKVTTNGVECITEKTITVNPNPTAEVIPDYDFCDDFDDNGNDGSITLTKADFDALIPSILGADQAESDYTVTFYSSADDASTSNNAITFPYTIPEKPITEPHWYVNSTEIFVRVENNTTACFNADTKFNLIVKPKPIFYEVDDIILCDDDRDGRVGGFDLTLRSDKLRSGDESTDPNDEDNQSPSDFTITYHRTLDDANNLESSGIENPDDFTIEQDNSQTIYFRIVKTSGSDSGCFVTGEAFDLVVQPLPVANDVVISRQCDGDAGDESQDGIYPFDTSNIQTTLLGGQTEVTTYYYYKDADNNDVLIGNELPNPFISGSQIITIQVENNTPQKCYDETTLEFIVDDSPEVYAVVFDSQCDDGPSDVDGYSEFNTSTITQTLLTNPETNQTQSLDLYSVEYEYIDVNGNTVTAAELPNPFNTNTQVVKATVTNKLNGACVISEDIQFTVDPLPIVNAVITVEQCDNDEDNDGKTKFNLTSYKNLISENSENEIFEYFFDTDLSDLITNPDDFENTVLYNQSIYVKVSTEQNCYRESRIDLKIGASQIPDTFVEDNNTKYTICETSPSTNQDGIEIWGSSIFVDINTKLVNSNTKFLDQNITISYYSSKEDALIKKDPIDISQNYTSITPFLQEIWAFVENNDLTEVSCEGLEKVAELYVEPRPVAYPVTIERQCDGDSDLDTDSQDGIYPFDTTNIIPTLLTNPDNSVMQDESILTITYFNEDGTEIPAASFSPTFATASQTITIRVERDPSYPDITNPDGLCYDETTLEFIVDDTPELYPVVFAPHCDGDDGNDDRDGFDQFDTSTLTADLIGPDQSLDDYEISYLYTDEDGNLLSAPELRNPFNTKTQTVTVTLINKINPTCPATATIEFIVNPLPEFTVDDATIVCLNLPPIPIGVTSAEAEYTYTWTHTDLSGNNSPFPSTEDTIFIGVGGTYYVTATTTDGTNCSRTLSIEVEESEIAAVTLDDITVEDLTSDNNNTITIDTANLGIGDYEFAIDDPNGPYQNDPFFENVRPGIHTIYIRDRNDCGIAQIDVSVIGYKKFFTPNGDGIHDSWRILGIREDFQPNSRVYIFNRYGKLLKELDPVTEGWDGTYLGRPMPQTDYWFRVFLEDGREFKGHFSLVRGRNGGNN